MQEKRPETATIIREKALELLEVDEENFRDGVEPFVGDYIAIRDAIREAGIKDDTVEFYRLFDAKAAEGLKSERAMLASNASLDKLLALAGNPEGGFLGLEKPDLTTDGILVIDIRWVVDEGFRRALEIELDMLEKLKARDNYEGEIWIVNFGRVEQRYEDYAQELAETYPALVSFKRHDTVFQSALQKVEEGRVILEARYYYDYTSDNVLIEKVQINKYISRTPEGTSSSIEIKKGFSLDLFALFRTLQEENVGPINLEDLLVEDTKMGSVLGRLDKKTRDIIVSRI